MPTNKQRRENERRRLQQQLEQRRERESARKRFTLIASIVGTLVAIAVIIVVIVVASGGDEKKKSNDAAGPRSGSPTTSIPTTTSPSPPPPGKPAKPAKGPSVTFNGVTVKGAADLTGQPGVTAKASKAPTKLQYKDLVVGKGAAAKPTSTVTVQYSGVLYKDGTPFDSSWSRGQAATFSLARVVPGFTQGIGGTKGVPPMKVGGRRIMILPAALGYGASGQGPIPPNSPLVFVVDLTKVAG